LILICSQINDSLISNLISFPKKYTFILFRLDLFNLKNVKLIVVSIFIFSIWRLINR